MTRTSKRTNVNVSLSEAQAAANLYAEASIKKDKLNAQLNEKLYALRQQFEPQITELEEVLAEPVELLETFAIEQRKNWDGKSIELANCVIGFRTNPPSVAKPKKVTWDYLVGMMKDSKLLKPFVRVKEDVDKAAILKLNDPKVLSAMQKIGIEIEQEENFFVDTKKDKAA